MFANLKKLISLDNPFRLLYHKMRAISANIYYSFPSKDMTIIWVTWTNGKTTTSNIIAKWLQAEWKKVFMFTTVNIIIWDEEYVNNTKMTSPDSFLLQKYLKIAKEKWCEIAVIETASHWILMNRILWLQYDFLVLTNITQDHLDLHRNMRNYMNTKLSLFKKLIYFKRKPGIKKTWVINVLSKYSELFIEETYDSLFKYWISAWNWANLVANNIRIEWHFTRFEVSSAGQKLSIKTKFKWNYNIENILAAIWVFIWLWIKSENIEKIIESVEWVPWRLELVKNDIWADIIVDYAHTPDSLEKVLSTLKDFNYKKIITVFWATGDRDKTKRAEMWEIVSKYSDIVILTQDDDYTEKTEKIINDILPGINRKEWENFWIITTRREAIETAISYLEKWDLLLLAWKWDEHQMITNDWPIEWHDKTIIQEILKWIDDNSIVEG